ncbi:hypothetical protein SS50377_24410 [Spironucleus salmonicida]|uniref:Uncharacterized protein n=1 Tax=Spironucleus salmonicida TaxID=348837 RepID=V6LN39_9EUKA|nr:hypothetical protein SS50377_24410 [Spironucleus salmonicida]|eukprot:EST46040.1 Hypothetical protein SS50377_14028 [Spironucleus salmonicida]
MQIIQQQQLQKQHQILSVSEVTIILLSTIFGKQSFTTSPNLPAMTAALLLDLQQKRHVDLFFCVNCQYINIRSTQQLSLIENFSSNLLGSVLAVLPSQTHQVNGPQGVLFQELVRITDRQVPVLVVDFLQCVKQTVWINQVLQDCTYDIQTSLVCRNILSESRSFIFFRNFQITQSGEKFILFIQKKARCILEQSYYVGPDEDFQEFESDDNYLCIYFATMLVSANCYSEITKATKISSETFSKFEGKLKALLGSIGAIVRTPSLKLQPDNIESRFVSIVVSLCAALKQSSLEDLRIL